ncbi:hypothetical protein KAOT1_04952 [Kordia algicida OT-1]|uniref:Uncharacterized protein n=1 Tax=Kordia algicida OT-1 TaxID=391587 RepID=A9DZD8_9FLAO|nr:hypothetical protein KAOT1_04952 [Kordia algicida OT-1]
MKKQEFKLGLNKFVVSNLNTEKLKGGTGTFQPESQDR